ncbi:hypothetical protein MNB_SV-9-574 [hydrothermal vent metagenome]|uniref:Uncharacterized protein n=1 Tax=hydrothermal vent metagenome TaxID=652676 RepID=A0A1W1BUY1_9ZZZZ
MKLYYYAFSGHKWGLDRVKRGVALIKALRDEDVEVQLLVNDFRAGLVAKELGVNGSVTIETIMDVDVMAEDGDIVFIDTPEEERGRVEQYSNRYKELFHIVDNDNMKSRFGEHIISPNGDLTSAIIDNIYFDILEKEDRVVFFLNDSDYEKTIISKKDFFEDTDMELILGNYFFVKYEDDLAKIFKTLYEPEDYSDLIRSSKRVVTASIQTALEARASEAKVLYILNGNEENSIIKMLSRFNIDTIDGFDKNNLSLWLNSNVELNEKVTVSAKEVAIKIKNKLNL